MRTTEIILGSIATVALGATILTMPRANNTLPDGPVLVCPVTLNQVQGLAQVLEPSQNGDYVVEALDYQCSPCHVRESVAAEFRTKNPKVGWLILQFPLGMHVHAYDLALVSYEAERQGHFTNFHDSAMANLIDIKSTVPEYLKRLGSSYQDFNLAIEPKIKERLDAIRHLPITHTPTIFVFRHDGKSGELGSIGGLQKFFAPKESKK